MNYTTVYMLRCADGSFYVGLTHKDLSFRLAEHEQGVFRGYTYRRRPVRLVWSELFYMATDAIACERRLKGWSRAKKEALIRGDYEAVSVLARNRQNKAHPSTSSG
jgi:putative endonuclease